MTPEEFRAARERLGLSDDALAAELGVTPHVVRAWSEGRATITRRHAQTILWRAAWAEREAAFAASGPPACPWMERNATETPQRLEDFHRYHKRLEEHSVHCEICQARERFSRELDERLGPMPDPPSPGWMRAFEWLERLPAPLGA
jgi:transcriptional regulator with XRE-family HTH domain